MNIIDIDTKEFNELKHTMPLRHETPTKSDNPILEKTIKKWAARHGADVVYKLSRPNGFLWIIQVEAK